MLKRLILAAALAVGLASPALAQQQYAGVSLYDLRGQPLGTSTNPLYVSGGGSGGGGGATGSVTPAGQNGGAAQAIQGITGGVPVNGFVGQYNSTLPTFSNAQVGYVALDSNGRLILSPGGSVSVSNFPATQAVSGTVTANQGTSPWVISGAVTNAGTFAVQNTAAVIGGNATAVKTDSSATTQPISATALPLPTGSSTAANQSSEIAALGTTADTAYGGSGNSSIVAALKGLYGQFNAATAKIQGSVWYAEGVSQSVAASATLTGTARGNVPNASPSPYGYFQAQVFSTAGGTLSISNGAYAITQAVTANTAVTLKVPALGGTFTASFINGTTAATVSLLDCYTLN